MNKGQRLVYVKLAKEIDWGICGFCKYHYCHGSACDDGDCSCEHKLEVVRDKYEFDYDVMTDCWAFRPSLKVQDIADIVGIVLSENFDPYEFMYWTDKEGQLHIAGNKLRSTPEEVR